MGTFQDDIYEPANRQKIAYPAAAHPTVATLLNGKFQ